MKTRIILCVATFVWFTIAGGFAGFFTALIVWAVIGLCLPLNVEPNAVQRKPTNDGELVPAKRGKPDPTRPSWTDEQAGRITEREHRGNS